MGRGGLVEVIRVGLVGSSPVTLSPNENKPQATVANTRECGIQQSGRGHSGGIFPVYFRCFRFGADVGLGRLGKAIAKCSEPSLMFGGGGWGLVGI